MMPPTQGSTPLGNHRAGWRRSPHLRAKWSQHQEWLLWCEKVKSGYPCEVYTKQVFVKASCTCEGRVHHLIIKIHIQIKQEYDHDARFHRHSVEVATGKRNQYENRLNKRFCDSQRLLSFEHAEICQYSSIFQLHPLLPMWFVESLTFFNMRSYGLQPSRCDPFPFPELHVLEPLVACRCRFWLWLMVAMIV